MPWAPRPFALRPFSRKVRARLQPHRQTVMRLWFVFVQAMVSAEPVGGPDDASLASEMAGLEVKDGAPAPVDDEGGEGAGGAGGSGEEGTSGQQSRYDLHVI